jgi:hypothetical protein
LGNTKLLSRRSVGRLILLGDMNFTFIPRINLVRASCFANRYDKWCISRGATSTMESSTSMESVFKSDLNNTSWLSSPKLDNLNKFLGCNIPTYYLTCKYMCFQDRVWPWPRAGHIWSLVLDLIFIGKKKT